MTDGERERETMEGGASPEAQRWAARQKEARAALAADRERELKQRAERNRRIEQELQNPVVFAFSVVAILLLLAAAWFIVDQMRCDPFYSDIHHSRLRNTCQ
ncbi:MAG: hypothetical protein ACLQIQ_01720 [Beijerinckiaceae bacterium]